MAPSMFSILAVAASALNSAWAVAVPQPVIDTDMPFLTSYADIAIASVAKAALQTSSSAYSSIVFPTPTTTEIMSIKPSSSAVATTVDTPYTNPFTIYLSMTNSLGVVTGMPSVVTSQPVVVTECAGCNSLSDVISSGSSFITITSSSNPITTDAVDASASSSGSASRSASNSVQTSTNAGTMNKATSASAALVVLGCVFALL